MMRNTCLPKKCPWVIENFWQKPIFDVLGGTSPFFGRLRLNNDIFGSKWSKSAQSRPNKLGAVWTRRVELSPEKIATFTGAGTRPRAPPCTILSRDPPTIIPHPRASLVAIGELARDKIPKNRFFTFGRTDATAPTHSSHAKSNFSKMAKNSVCNF